MKTPVASFPLRDELRPGESGHGYTLRMATANFLNGLPAVKNMLGKTRFAVLDAEDAPTLSRWFGADPKQLARALGRTGTGSEPDTYELAGATLTRSYFLNRSQPRVCARCLKESGICRLAWEISANPACSSHGHLLTAICPSCCGALRWDRPHSVQCRCGWSLQMTATEPASSEELDVSAWIEARLGNQAQPTPRTGLGRLFAPLGLDAGLHILGALGSFAERARTPVPMRAEARKRNSIVNARQNITHAMRALDAIGNGAAWSSKICFPLSAHELLAEAAACAYAPPERQLPPVQHRVQAPAKATCTKG